MSNINFSDNFQTTIRATLMRGGTSKGLFLNPIDLPSTISERDNLLLSIMGSPDATGMQLNGIGGGISSTSKVALISKSKRPNIDVDYLFGHVYIKEPYINWSGSCGNLAAAVGLYAINNGFAQLNDDGSCCVKVWQVNLGYEIHVHIPKFVKDNLVSIPGVPGQENPIYVEFLDPSAGNSILPNNKPIHFLNLPSGKTIPTTLILGANPTIFLYAKDLGLQGHELPDEIDFTRLDPIITSLSQQGALIMGIKYNPSIRVSWLAEPLDYKTSDGNLILQEKYTLLGRISTENRVHHAFTGTGAINLACAAKIPGTIPFNIINNNLNKNPISIGHPQGIIQVDANVEYNTSEKWVIKSSGFIRTAKTIMSGHVYP